MSQDRDRDLRRLKALDALAAEQAGTPEGELSAQRAQETRARLGLPQPRTTAPPPRPGSGGRPKRKPRGGGKPKRKPSLTPEARALAMLFAFGLAALGGGFDRPRREEEGAARGGIGDD